MGDDRMKLHQFPYFILCRGNDLAGAGLHAFAIFAGV
jgi:hypothetical protein